MDAIPDSRLVQFPQPERVVRCGLDLRPAGLKVELGYGWQCIIPVPHAVDTGQGRALIMGGYYAGSAMIEVEKKADCTYGVTEIFKTVEFGSYILPSILYKDRFLPSTPLTSAGMVWPP